MSALGRWVAAFFAAPVEKGGGMSSGSIPDFSSDFIPDVTYTGALDTNPFGDFSGSSTLQDTIVGSPTLSLDTSYGATDGSVYDLMDGNDPYLSQALSGTSDPPIDTSLIWYDGENRLGAHPHPSYRP